MSKNQNLTVHDIAAMLQTHTTVLLTGLDSLEGLRATLLEAQRQLGVEVVFDPNSDADLVQILAGTTMGAAEGALKGAAVGLIVGALLKDPAGGMKVGAAIGAVVGAANGANNVKKGWRVRLSRQDGQPVAEIMAVDGALR